MGANETHFWKTAGRISASNGVELKTPTLYGLERWAKEGLPGARFVYHAGLLLEDRHADAEVDKLAQAAAKLVESGAASMVQRRIGENFSLYEIELRR